MAQVPDFFESTSRGGLTRSKPHVAPTRLVMQHPHELCNVLDSTSHVLQAEQVHLTRSVPAVILLYLMLILHFWDKLSCVPPTSQPM